MEKIINALNKIFESDRDLLTASYGRIYEYLGMTIDWSTEGGVVFTMYDYLEDILDEAPDEFDGEDVPPAISELFTVNLTHQKLDTSIANLFHRIVTKFLYIAKQARPDLQVTVAFLCKRVKCLNVGNWKKLGRLVRYVRVTIYLPLILGLNGTGNMVWSIDASFAGCTIDSYHDDVSDAFPQCTHHSYIVHGNVSLHRNKMIISVALHFGGNYGPASWEPPACVRCFLAQWMYLHTTYQNEKLNREANNLMDLTDEDNDTDACTIQPYQFNY